MPKPQKLLPASYRNKLRPSLSPLLPYLLAQDREVRRTASENKESIIRKYKTLSWPHWNLSLFSDLLELKLANELSGEQRPHMVSILGGSKTGKSFIFNHLLNKQLAPSGVGVTTHSVLVYLHRRWSWENLRDRYFPRPSPGLAPLEDKNALCDSLTHRIYCQEHNVDAWSDLVLIDTPDFNREDDDNVRLAYMAWAVSDVVLYVFTPETYADACGTIVARLAYECGKTIIPVYNMVDAALMDQPSKLSEDYRKLTKTPQQHGDGVITPAPYPFFPDNFFAASWLDLRREPKAPARIEPVNFPSNGSCLDILAGLDQNKRVLPQTIAKTAELLDSVTPDIETVFQKTDRIKYDLARISEQLEVDFPLPEAARAIYEVLEGFRPETINKFLSGVDKFHEKTFRLVFEWIKNKITRDQLTRKSPEAISEERLQKESRIIVRSCLKFADSMQHFSGEFGLLLSESLKLNKLKPRQEELELQVYKTLQKEDALAEVKEEMTADMSQNPARGLFVYSDVAMRISAVAGAILLTGEGVLNILWGTLGEAISQPLARIFIGRVGGARLLERYYARRRQRYQEIIEDIVLTEAVQALEKLPGRDDLETVRRILTEITEASELNNSEII